MVKRRRLTSLTNADEKTQSNGMITDGNCMTSRENAVRNSVGAREVQTACTRSKQKAAAFAGTEIQPVAKITPEEAEEKVTKGGPTLRTSARTQKKPKREISPPPQPTSTKKPVAKSAAAVEQVKTRRSWELWSVEDKNTFFEALCEFGKDFESIQHYLAQKNKKKGHSLQLIKNKDQVRHFYYRTWHKISKYLDIAHDIKKQTQELYGLINYGELRKKIGGRLDEKNKQKLNELVHNGATTIRFKGKNLRIKTPLCRALKKLNNVDDHKDEEQPKLPPKVSIEFRPHSNAAWTYIQSLAQNPRLRMTLTLQRRLSTVIEYLQKRWRPHRVKQKEQLLSMVGGGDSTEHVEQGPVLRIFPRKDAKITLVKVKPTTENLTSTTVSLQNHRDNFSIGNLLNVSTLPSLGKKGSKSKNRNSFCEENRKGSLEEKVTIEEEPKPLPLQTCESEKNSSAVSSTPLGSESSSKSVSVALNSELLPEPNVPKVDHKHSVIKIDTEDTNSLPAHEITLRQLLALENAADPKPTSIVSFGNVGSILSTKAPSLISSSPPSGTDLNEPLPEINSQEVINIEVNAAESSANASAKVTAAIEEDHTEEIEKIKRGWNSKEANTLTVGELYLMMGNPSKMILEYEWETEEMHQAPIEGEECSSVKESKQSLQRLADMLKKLLQVVNTEKQNKQNLNPLGSPCRCGHTCGSSSSSSKSVASRSPANSRVSNKNQKAVLPKAHLPTVGMPVASGTNAKGNADQSIFLIPSMTAPQSRVQAGKAIVTTAQQNKIIAPDKAFKEQLDKFLPPHRKARGRKSVVVQRELPLLPKASQTHSMMTLRIVPSSSQLAGSFMPVVSTGTLSPAMAMPTNPAGVTKIMKLPIGTTKVTTLPANLNAATAAAPFIAPGLTTTSYPVTTSSGSSYTVLTPISSSSPSSSSSATLSSGLTTTTSSLSTVAISSALATKPTVTNIPSSSDDTHLNTLLTPINISTETSQNLENSLTLNALVSRPSPGASVVTTASSLTSIPEISIPEPSSGSFTASPPSVSSLLDLSLLSCEDFNLQINTTKTLPESLPSLSNDPLLDSRSSGHPNSPTHSPFKVASMGLENQWLNGEQSNDFCLSTLLGNLESPTKQQQSTSTNNPVVSEASMDPMSRLAPDVETHLQCLMNENSVDYISKFVDLAAQMATTENVKKSSSSM